MYREKLMKVMIKVDDAVVFMNGMKQELYRNQEALRSLLIACLMILIYNAEYSELLTLAVFGHNFYKALVLVSDNYLEHNEDIHVVNVIGQDETVEATVAAATPKKETIAPPPNSPMIVPFDSTKGVGDAYESVEDMKSTPMEEKLKEYVKNGLLDEKAIQAILTSKTDQIMEKYSQMGLERMTQKDYDPTKLENVEGFADMNDAMEECANVDFPTPSIKTQGTFDKRVVEYMKNRDAETVKPSSKLSVVSLEFDKRMEEYIKTANVETSGSTEFDRRVETYLKQREDENARQLMHEEQLDVRQNEIVET